MFMFPLQNLARKELKYIQHNKDLYKAWQK